MNRVVVGGLACLVTAYLSIRYCHDINQALENFGVGSLALKDDGGEQAGTTVVVDSSFSGDWAKNGCEQVKQGFERDRNPEMMPRYTACITAFRPATLAQIFEDDLMTQFAINQLCKGITFSRYYGPAEPISSATKNAPWDTKGWTLTIFYDVGAETQTWVLAPKKGFDHRANGSTPTKIAGDVCAIVSGHGGTVLQ
jgi:hypothetical protein